MKYLEIVYEITKQLDEELGKQINTSNREAIIEQINDLIEQRGIHLKKVTPPYTEREKEIGKNIVKLNDRIKSQMNSLFKDLKIEMKQVKNQRQSNISYTNPYKNVQTLDGMFLDSKQ